MKLLRLREKPLEGITHGYSLAASWSTRLTDRLLHFPERALLSPWYRRIRIDRPIFIIGPFRSGTTILEKIISEHPGVGYFRYASNIFPKAPVSGHLFLTLLWTLGVLDRDHVALVHNPRFLSSALSPYECEWIWSQSAKNLWDERCADLTAGADFSDPAFERYLFSVIRRHMMLQRGSRFLNKNPVNCVRLRYLKRLFPDARFVTIVRDPIDTIVSHYRNMLRIQQVFYGDPATERILKDQLHMDLLSMRIKTRNYAQHLALEREHPLLGIANQWKDLQQEVLDSVADTPGLAEQVFPLRYEELVSKPTLILGELWDFLGLVDEHADRVTAAYAGRLTAPPKSRLSAEESRYLPRIREIVAPVAARMGYSP